MENEMSDVKLALARIVAGRQMPDDIVEKLAGQVATTESKIRGLSVCERGICIDYIVDSDKFRDVLPGLLEAGGGRLQGIEIFPWGIVNPDLFHVQVVKEFDELRELGTLGIR